MIDPSEHDFDKWPVHEQWTCGHTATSMCSTCYAELVLKANALAAENEQLRAAIPPAERYWEARWRDEKAENERLRDLVRDKDHVAAKRLLKIERLRAALQEIVVTDPPPTSEDWFQEWKNLAFKLRGIARRALEGK